MKKAGKYYKHWSQVARNGLAWARKRNRDAFWAYRTSLATFIGRGNGRTLDVGAGKSASPAS